MKSQITRLDWKVTEIYLELKVNYTLKVNTGPKTKKKVRQMGQPLTLERGRMDNLGVERRDLCIGGVLEGFQ